MSLEARVDKLERAIEGRAEGGYCQCPLIYYRVGCNDSEFYASHPECGKPIDREATYYPASIYESRVIHPGTANREEVFTDPPSEGYSRVFIRDFS